MLFVPLFGGALLRRDRNVWVLVVSGVLGLGVHFLTMYAYFGDALSERGGYISAIEPPPELLFDQFLTSTDRPRIWRISRNSEQGRS